MNYKRRKPREKVRCSICTDNRENIGGNRQRERQQAPDALRVTNGYFWDWCPDCAGTGKCDDCPNGICVLCGGSKIYDFVRPRAG